MTSLSSALDGNKRLVSRFIEECWNGGALATVSELIAGDCRYHDAVFPHMVGGVESMQRHISRCRKAFPDLKFTITDSIAENDEVTVRWTASATQAAEFLGMPTANRNASIAGTSIYRIDEGKIVEQWVQWNLMSLMEQLGAGSASVAAKSHPGTE